MGNPNNRKNLVTPNLTGLTKGLTESRTLGDLVRLVKFPLITEKSVNLYENNTYVFIVDKSMTKPEIKYVLEKIFDIKIVKINTALLPIKTKRVGKYRGKKSVYKKTFIRLKEGDFIRNLLE
jgi:large subunit ribosomal protein L23